MQRCERNSKGLFGASDSVYVLSYTYDLSELRRKKAHRKVVFEEVGFSGIE